MVVVSRLTSRAINNDLLLLVLCMTGPGTCCFLKDLASFLPRSNDEKKTESHNVIASRLIYVAASFSFFQLIQLILKMAVVQQLLLGSIY